MKPIRVIKAGAEHASVIARLNEECLGQGWSEDAIAKDIAEHDYFLAIDGESVTGYACVWYMPPEAELEDICVSEKSRRRGAAQALMNELLSEAVKRGCDTVCLEVRQSNAPAIALYEKNGFERVGLRKKYYSNKEDAVIMSVFFKGEK